MRPDEAWKKHRQWSAVADRLKRGLVRARWTVLILAILGAALETLAAQFDPVQAADARRNAAFVGALFLTASVSISGRFLGKSRRRSWIRARSASEAIKSEVYHGLARVAGHENSAQSGERLSKEVQKIERDVSTLYRELLRVDVGEPGAPHAGADQYIKLRLEEPPGGQIAWYQREAKRNDRLAGFFRVIELGLTALGAFLGLAASHYRDEFLWVIFSIEINLSISAWVAVITTFSAAITAHIGASRYDHLATTYLATAGGLRISFGSRRSRQVRTRPRAASGPTLCSRARRLSRAKTRAGWRSGVRMSRRRRVSESPEACLVDCRSSAMVAIISGRAVC